MKNRSVCSALSVTRQIAKISKTGVAGMAHDNVVEHFDLQKLSGANEVASDFDVRFGWCRITARMIVRDDDCRRTCHNCQSKNLHGMTKDRIHRANGDQIMTFNPPTCVENEHHQTFTFRIELRMSRDMRFPMGGCLIRCFALLHVFGCGTFPQ